jgi:hypothetical protein
MEVGNSGEANQRDRIAIMLNIQQMAAENVK